jgi:hypothetical protein
MFTTNQVLHTLFIPPHIALESAMACRVFRSLRLGLILEAEDTTAHFSTQRHHLPQAAVMASSDRSVPGVYGSGNSHHRPVGVGYNQKWEGDNSEVVFGHV